MTLENALKDSQKTSIEMKKIIKWEKTQKTDYHLSTLRKRFNFSLNYNLVNIKLNIYNNVSFL